MKINFVRSVGALLTVCGLIALSFATVGSVLKHCSDVSSSACLATAVTFGMIESATLVQYYPSTDITHSSVRESIAPTSLQTLLHVIQITSVYAILIGLVILIMLECKELHYLKQLVKKRRRSF